jgi:hypothetical protein
MVVGRLGVILVLEEGGREKRMRGSEGGSGCAKSPGADVVAVELVLACDQALSGYYRMYIGRQVMVMNMHFN